MNNNKKQKKHNLVLWSKIGSFFEEYCGDTDQHFDECFEFDWNCSKVINNFIL